MASFSIKTKDVQLVVANLSDSANKIGNYNELINQVKGSLMSTLARSGNVQKRLEHIVSDCDEYRGKLNKMSGKLDEIIMLYVATENKIVDNSTVQSPSQPNTSTVAPVYPSMPSDEELLSGNEQLSEEGVWDYILRSLEQILLGSFTEESTLVGIIGSVLVGCIPYVGLAADIRDIVGDLYQFRDGVETEEVLSLVVDVVAIIPLCDLLKYADDCLGLTKYLDEAGEALGGLIDYAKGTWKNADEIISKVDDLVDKGGEFVNHMVNGAMDLFNKTPDGIKKTIIKADNMLSKKIGEDTVGGVVKDVIEEYIGVEDKLIDAAAGVLDNIGNGIKTGIEDIKENVSSGLDNMWDMITGQQETVYV